MLRNMTIGGSRFIRPICCIPVIATILFAQSASADDDWWQNQHARTDWVFKELSESDVASTLDRVLKNQERWAKLPENAPTEFSCTKLEIPPPSAAALSAFDTAASTKRGPEADRAYAKAASLGSWRAAARLVNSTLQDEYWEGAVPIVGWLLAHHVPAGYNKLADVFQARLGYDGEPAGDGALNMIESLRWRAAREGDPVAQAQMADIFDKINRPVIAASLRACAIEQNPDIAR